MWPNLYYTRLSSIYTELVFTKPSRYIRYVIFVIKLLDCQNLVRHSTSKCRQQKRLIKLCWTSIGRSLINNKNNTGPRTEPWGTPMSHGQKLDMSPLMATPGWLPLVSYLTDNSGTTYVHCSLCRLCPACTTKEKDFDHIKSSQRLVTYAVNTTFIYTI